MTVENVLLITIDSLRHDYRQENAPTITSLAEEGTSFENAFATGPGTTPSFPGILTGTYPLSYGGLGKLSEERPFLAKKLRSRGMATAGFHSNPFLTESFNYDIGFETFEDYQDSLMDFATKLFPQGIEKSVIPGPVTTAFKKSYELIYGKPRPYEQAEVITDDAISWLETESDGFFEWVHYMDVHHPCFPPDSYLRKFDMGNITNREISNLYSRAIEEPASVTDEEHEILLNSYRASLRYVDDQIDRLLSVLRERGLFQETMVIVTSDHGQLFGDFNEYGKPYRLYDALIEIPLIVQNGPDTLPGHVEDPVSLIDLPPVIHDTLGFDQPDRYEGQPIGSGKSREWILAEHQVNDDVLVGIRTENEKYVVDNTADDEKAYSISPDGESEINPNRIDGTLKEQVLKRLDEIDVDRPEYVSQVDTATEQRLEDLGYL